MSKFIKKILNFQKRKNGNISILVLVMSLAIILLTTAMVGYIFHDIGFTELDKGELRALHFAESGLSYMYYKIEQYSKGLIPDLPVDPDTPWPPVDVGDPDNPEGRFTVKYHTDDKGGLEFYTITSTGIDISSGATRTVRVNTLSFDIFDFIYSGEAMGAEKIKGQTNITGPLFVNGDFGLVIGNSSFLEGPLFVKGDITISGSSSIGKYENPIILFLGGNINGSPFDPESPPDNVYVSEYYNTVVDVTLPTIDKSYIDLVKKSDPGTPDIDGNLFIGKIKEKNVERNVIMKSIGMIQWEEVNYPGYLEFNNYGILKISGSIVVNGDIYIGEPPKGLKNVLSTPYTIEYSGNGNLISTGDITVGSQVIPENNLAGFPSSDLMALISLENIYLNLTNAIGDKHDDDPTNPKIAAMLIANKKIETSENTFLRGGSVSNSLVLGQNTQVYYEEGIGKALATGIPGFSGKIFVLNWQEIIAD